MNATEYDMNEKIEEYTGTTEKVQIFLSER